MAEGGLPGSQRATDQATRYREAVEKIRQRTEYTSKGLAAIGIAAITGIGYTKLADVFPYGGPCWAIAALGIGVLLMIAAVLLTVLRFEGASESVFTSARLDQTFDRNDIGEKDKEEKDLIATVYSDTAGLNGADSLLDYERRGRRFERIAERSDETRGAALRARADQIFTEVLATQDRAAALLLRKRARDAVFGLATLGLLVLFVAGWYSTALGADALQSERKDKIDAIKSCTDLRVAEATAGTEATLPEICDTKTVEKTKTPAAQTARAGVTALGEALETCLNTAEENEEEPSACDGLERALIAVRSGGN
jgi:hypothetical protein